MFASNRAFLTMDELISDYESGALHPADVKPALAKAINEILQVKIFLYPAFVFSVNMVQPFSVQTIIYAQALPIVSFVL